MRIVCLHSRDESEPVLRRDVYLHLYTLGDLDDFFWPYTTWYALEDGDRLLEVVLLYSGGSLPTLLGLTSRPDGPMRSLLSGILRLLPPRLYAHLSGDLVRVFEEHYSVESHGEHYKMALADPTCLDQIDTSAVVHLSTADLSELASFYDQSYPGNWFDPRMLETGYYYGVRHGRELASAAGVHVYSARYGVAALGNVTTHPLVRGRGYATAAAARLCRELLASVEHIGLNVKADNGAAIASYRRLGFTRVASYEESLLRLRHVPAG